MARTDYGAILSTVITGTSQSIRNKEGTTDLIAPVNWSREISRMNHSLVDTTSGSVCSFDDGADNVPIKLLQASISGTGCNVVRTGKNLCGSVIESGSFDENGLNTTNDTRARTKDYIPVKAGQTISVSFDHLTVSQGFFAISGYTKDDYTTPRIQSTNWIEDGGSVTIDAGVKFVRINFRKDNNAQILDGQIANVMVVYGSTSSSYIPYTTGTTYPISWSTEVGTVTSGTMQVNADGTIDVTSGGTTTRLTSTVDIRTLLGTNNIWCDTGDISNLIYYMDMDLYIQSGLIEETVASAPVASFSDGMKAYPLKELSLSINPTQSGSGDPSPDNIRPISGVSSVNAYRTGKNLLDKSIGKIDSNRYIAFGVDNFSDTTPNGNLYLKEGTYTFSVSGENSTNWETFAVYDETNTRIILSYNRKTFSFTINTEGAFKILLIISSENFVSWDNYDIQLERNASETAYEPYTGNTYLIQLGDTYYGATLDVVRGKLVVDRGLFLLSDITLSYTNNSGKPYVYAIVSDYYGNGSYTVAVSDCICSMLPAIKRTSIMDNGTGFQIESNHGFYIADNDIDKSLSAQDFIDAVQTKYGNAQFCCPLTTPIEIDLTPTQINSLLGSNSLWHDGNGNTSCEYYANGQLYVEQHST